MVLKEGGGPLCSLDCDPLSRSLSLKVLAQGKEHFVLPWRDDSARVHSIFLYFSK